MKGTGRLKGLTAEQISGSSVDYSKHRSMTGLESSQNCRDHAVAVRTSTRAWDQTWLRCSGRDLAIAIAAVLPGKLDNIGGETLLVVTTARDLALRRAMLPALGPTIRLRSAAARRQESSAIA